MKIAIAQNRPVVGRVENNLAGHQAFLELAVRHGAELIVFPELSLTGYEPQMAMACVRSADSDCFAGLQSFADENGLMIGIGVPTPGDRLPRISTVLFRPGSKPEVFSKQHLHADELPYFEPGPAAVSLIHANPKTALAICYELSVPAHAVRAAQSGATTYLASVAKHSRGVDEAYQRLSEIAREHSMLVMMSNCLGFLDGAECAGRSAAWGRDGRLLGQLDAEHEGVLVVDNVTEQVVAVRLPALRA